MSEFKDRYKDRYYEYIRIMQITDNNVSRTVTNYVTELEQQLSKLKESQKQKQIIRLCERLDKAEQQNKQMIEALIMIYKTWHEDSILISSTKPIIESVTGKPIEEATK